MHRFVLGMLLCRWVGGYVGLSGCIALVLVEEAPVTSKSGVYECGVPESGVKGVTDDGAFA